MLKASQTSMYIHSDVKVSLLKTYLDMYLNILWRAKYYGDIYVYDLFCGPGIYSNGGKGSPILIVEAINTILADTSFSGSKTAKFHCTFNDYDKEKVSGLSSHVKKLNLDYHPQVAIQYFTKDYKQIVAETIQQVKQFTNQKGFIFIDPYGYKEIKVADIKQLLECGHTEVLLFLPTQFMFRFEAKGTPESLKDFISELMPAEQWPTSETGVDFIQNLTDALRKEFSNNFVDSFIITRDKNQFFALFFFTSHIYGFDRMLEAKWKLDEEEGRGWAYGSNNDLFSCAEKKPDTIKFERKLIEYLKEARSNAQIYAFTLHQGHRPLHTNEILSKLQAEGKIKCTLQSGLPAIKGAFYLNYDNYNNNPLKVTIQIK